MHIQFRIREHLFGLFFCLPLFFEAYHVLFIGSDFDFNNPIVLLQKVIYIANEESGALISSCLWQPCQSSPHT